jgi:hypothetical protein
MGGQAVETVESSTPGRRSRPLPKLSVAAICFAGNLTDDPEPGHPWVVIVITGSPMWRRIRCVAPRR